MSRIELITEINAPIQLVFDLSRSIDLHMALVEQTGERAIAGITTGLIGNGEEVTWRARYFGIWQTLTTRITMFDPPHHFRDSMVQGAFARFDHDHFFDMDGPDRTIMRDLFDFDSPFGILGRMVNALFLKR